MFVLRHSPPSTLRRPHPLFGLIGIVALEHPRMVFFTQYSCPVLQAFVLLRAVFMRNVSRITSLAILCYHTPTSHNPPSPTPPPPPPLMSVPSFTSFAVPWMWNRVSPPIIVLMGR